jgi:hypothetical protein
VTPTQPVVVELSKEIKEINFMLFSLCLEKFGSVTSVSALYSDSTSIVFAGILAHYEYNIPNAASGFDIEEDKKITK